jgi:hypothetical protein
VHTGADAQTSRGLCSLPRVFVFWCLRRAPASRQRKSERACARHYPTIPLGGPSRCPSPLHHSTSPRSFNTNRPLSLNPCSSLYIFSRSPRDPRAEESPRGTAHFTDHSGPSASRQSAGFHPCRPHITSQPRPSLAFSSAPRVRCTTAGPTTASRGAYRASTATMKVCDTRLCGHRTSQLSAVS